MKVLVIDKHGSQPVIATKFIPHCPSPIGDAVRTGQMWDEFSLS